ncbi:unnamed protein product [Rotaria sordida]|uniref:Uncharacterized protein n=1 Tax=Rotaria sordida TaxID=392033 RepID=A0A814KGY6_9BILA|nr:unnamed protein product [Rotaria sordida]CAF1556237.1 unnamed protein product [Rotaria sordida]
MAVPYSTNYPPTINDQGQQPQPDNFYIPPNPYYYDGNPYTPDSMYSTTDSATSQYTSDSGSETDSYSIDDYSPHPHRHHHHHHHRQHQHHQSDNSDTRPTIKIRRHVPGTNDPLLQKFPTNLESSDNTSSSSPVRVTIKRHKIEPEQNLIQPVLYPVPVYVKSPVPQNSNNPPIQIIQPVLPVQSFLPIEQIKEIAKPPSSPKKPPTTPIKTPPNPPLSPDRYETELFRLPSRNQKSNISIRKPIRTDLITPTPSKINSIPKKTILYQTAPGLTTREIENNEIGQSRQSVYLQSPKNQIVTYRKS